MRVHIYIYTYKEKKLLMIKEVSPAHFPKSSNFPYILRTFCLIPLEY